MRKYTAFVLALVCVLGLIGCNQQGQQDITTPTQTQNNEGISQTDIQSESDQNTDLENDVVSTSNIKNILKLEYRDTLGFELDTEEPKVNSIHLEYSNVPESQGQKYESSDMLKVFADYVSQSLSVDLDSKWTVFVHYYDEEKTVGMVEFIYTIGQINTNKSIVFNLNNGIADTVYYRYLQEEVNEEDILHRVSLFNNKYEQEKKILGEDEKLVKETTNFTYYYNADKLVYSYAVFFSYGEHQVVNNDYGTVCEIDSEGNAIQESVSTETISAYTYEELSEMPAEKLLDLFIQNGLVINDDLKASFTEEELQVLFKENFHLWHTGVSAHSYTMYIDLAEQTKVIYDKITE